MRKILAALVFGTLIASVNAAPITFTDIVDPNPDHLFNGSGGSNAVHSFNHSLLDDGYNSVTDVITAAAVILRFSDESVDSVPELVAFTFDGFSFGSRTITSGGAIFAASFSDASLIALLSDGLLSVTLTNAGATTGASANRSDFVFLDATLTIDAERTLPPAPPLSPIVVPEPGSLALVALALGAVGGLRGRRANTKA